MAKKDVIEAEGIVVDAQPNAMFVVELDGSGHKVFGNCFRKNQNELHTDPSRGQSKGGTFTL